MGEFSTENNLKNLNTDKIGDDKDNEKKKNKDKEEENEKGESEEERQARLAREAEEENLKREQELMGLENALNSLLRDSTAFSKEKIVLEAALRSLESQNRALENNSNEMKQTLLLKKKILGMLPDAPEHIAQLQEIVSKQAEKLTKLATKWENHRKPKIEILRNYEEDKKKRKEKARELVTDIKTMKAEIKDMISEIHEKEARANTLAEEYNRMARNINRNMYTRRILDIIQEIDKQKVDIEGIIGDITHVQRDIQSITENVKRVDVLVEEKIFRAAHENRDNLMAEIYRNLKDMRDKFSRLLTIVSK